MKIKLLIFTILIVALLLPINVVKANTNGAVGGVGVQYDAGMFVAPGMRGSFIQSVSITGTNPFNINSKTINLERRDTTITMNVYVSGAIYKGSSVYDNNGKLEIIRGSTYIRKTLGIHWLSLDGGASVWQFIDLDDDGDDKTYVGPLLGLNAITNGFIFNLKAHAVMIVNETDKYAFTASLGYAF